MRTAIFPVIGMVLAAAPAMAQEGANWWHGAWAKTGAGCVAADVLTLDAQLWRTEDSGCDILDASAIPGLNAVRLALACLHGNDSYAETRLLMKSDDGLWIWYGGEAPVYYQACVVNQEN